MKKEASGRRSIQVQFEVPGTPEEVVMAGFTFYFYGDQAAETVARETPRWQAWILERFPTPAESSKSG